MKKILMALLCVFLLGTNASALQFNLDLSGFDNDYGTYDDIFRINVDGFANVNQSFGADGIFDNGDTFTEMTLLQKITYKNSLIGTNKSFTGVADNNMVLYMYAEGLTGTAFNITGTSLDDATFNYNFDPGVGSMGIYLDTDSGVLTHNAGTAQLVGSFSLTEGDGAALDGFLGGIANAGTSRLSADFLAATPDGVWSAAGLDLGNLPVGYTAFAELNTTNQVVEGPFLYGERTDINGNIIGYDGFTSTINSTGHMAVGVVPETSTLLLLGGGLMGLAFLARRKRS